MLRATQLPRSQPAVLNSLLITKRWQQMTSTADKSTTSNPTLNTKIQTNSTKPSISTSTSKFNSSSKFSEPPKASGGGGKLIKSLVFGVTFGLTATLIYAEYENGPFRRQLESTIPYSSTILGGIDQVVDPILGRQKPSIKEPAEKIPDLSYKKDAAAGKGQLKPIIEQPKETAQKAVEKLPEKTQIQKVGQKAIEAVDHATDKVKDAVHHARDSLPTTTSIKKNIAHAKEQVEEKVHTVKETIKEAMPSGKGTSGDLPAKVADPVLIEEAGETGVKPPVPEDKYKKLEEEISHLLAPLTKQIEDALTAAHEHISHMKTIIDHPNPSSADHETWKKAEHLQEKAKTSYEKVANAIHEWKNKLTEYTKSTDGKVHPEEKKLNELYQELQKQYTTSTFVKNFRTYIDEATKSFQKEIETMFPSLAGKSPAQLTQEDLQALLVHAHRRVVKLQNDIARIRVNESDSVKAAIDVALLDVDRRVEDRVRERVQKTTEQLTDELKNYEKNLRQQFDEQLKHEIVIQHQALSQYLADVLSRQYQEWAHEYEKQLENESIKINISLQDQLRHALNRLHAIEQAIEANYDSQVRGRQAQQLWIQAQTILNQIVHGTTTQSDLDAVASIVPNEKFVQILINELRNDDSSTTNEEMLRERFKHVKTLCRRVALIDAEHNSLWNYFLSYLQSLLIVRQRDDSILTDDAVDLNKLNTFRILNYVQSYLEHNQWYNALRLMQLLNGEARNVAQSWINDTRNYLAKKQTSELLEAYSNSIGLGTLPRTA